MDALRYSAYVVSAALVSGCGTPEQRASFTGVRPSDAEEISRFIHSRTSGQIAYYTREPNGDVAVWMRVGHDPRFPDIHGPDRPFHAYVVRRINGKWQIVDEPVFVGEH